MEIRRGEHFSLGQTWGIDEMNDRALQPIFLFTRPPDFQRTWPFLELRLRERLGALGKLRVLQLEPDQCLSEKINPGDVTGLVWFGGQITRKCLDAMPFLRMIGCNTDNTGRGLPFPELVDRRIPVIDTTRAWAPSVAEMALCLALGALRRVPQWHSRLAAGEKGFAYEFQQFCDDPDFVSGELGTKRVGVVGLGQIGSRVAKWCSALGSRVESYDPFLSVSDAKLMDVSLVGIDRLVDTAEVLFVTVPPTPTAFNLLNRERIGRLKIGTLLVVATRAHAIDMIALRERIVANELAGAFDVYDVEPLPFTDALRNRPNVVHTPHIAGRTIDANHRTAELIATDFERILKGETPAHELTENAVSARLATSLPD